MKSIQLIMEMGDGGAETLVKDYAKILKRHGNETTIVTLYDIDGSANMERIRNFDIHYESVLHKRHFISKVLNNSLGGVYVTYKLKKIIEKLQPDVIHVHLSMLHYLPKISDELKGIKLFYTCHSLPERFLKEGSEEYLAAKYLINNNGMRLIALHEQMRKELNELFRITNTAVIKNGVDFNAFQNIDESKKEIRREINVPEDAFVLGHVGRFMEMKNHEFLLEILEKMVVNRPKAFLLMIGDGELKEKIKATINSKKLDEHCLILSNRTDINRLMKAMDVFVFPSKFEGLPVTLVEAQAAGLKCVISDRINTESILSDRTIPVKLDAPTIEWINVILDNNIRNMTYGNLTEFDLNREIVKLEKLYNEP